MPDNSFYQQLRSQFDKIIEQDKRRRRRTALLLLTFHLVLVIGLAIYIPYAIGYARYPTEILLVTWGTLALSWVVHALAVLLLNRSDVSETVRESLMLIASHQGNLGTPELAEKRKRNRHEPDIDELESDSLYITDDGELRHTSERR